MTSEHVKGATFVRAVSAVACSLSVLFFSGCGALGLAPNPGIQGAQSTGRGEALKVPGHSKGAPTIPATHVLTWGLLGGPLGTHKITWLQAAPYLTWAMTGSADSAAIKAVGIKTAVYTNPNRQGPKDPLYTSDESTFVHDCSGHRIFTSYHPDHALMDVQSPSLWRLWKNYVQQITVGWGGVFDAIYDDQADNVQYATGQACSFNWNAWTIASNEMNWNLGVPIIFNSLSLFSGYGKTLGLSPSIGLNASTIGGEAEACYSAYRPNEQPPHMYEWQALENTEIAMSAAGHLFLCGGGNHKPADQAIAERMYTDASFLLTYDLNTSMLSEHFSTPSQFEVEPESQLVALQPLLPEPKSISGLLVYTGIYGREYGACYIGGLLVGPCATVVNSQNLGTYKAFPWPGKYQHTLVLTGGGVLDGGTIATNGPPPPAKLNGEQGVIAFP